MNTHRKLLVIVAAALTFVAAMVIGASASSSATAPATKRGIAATAFASGQSRADSISLRSLPGKPDDGLPKQWFGVTRWTEGDYGEKNPYPYPKKTVAEVTLTLTTKSPTSPFAKGRGKAGKPGTYYGYVPRGKITVTGWCGYASRTTAALNPGDGFLSILVPTRGPRGRAAYLGRDFTGFSARAVCSGIRPSGSPDSWGFQTEFSIKPSTDYKHTISTAAEVIKGTYVMNDTLAATQPNHKYEWCFVRDRQNLGKCR